VDHLAVGQRWGAALDAELAETRLHLVDRPPVLLAVLVPARAIVDRQPRVGRRQLRILELERVAGDDPDPGAAACGNGRKGTDVVLDDDVGLELVEDLDEPLVDVAGAVEQGLPGRRHELAELIEGRLPEDRRRLPDEVLPELPWLLLDLGGRGEAHQALLEALLLECPRERLLDHEDHPVPAAPQHLADPHAVVRRPECALRKEDDRLSLGLRHAGESMPETTCRSGRHPFVVRVKAANSAAAKEGAKR
jgi:hypothetical protein